jgi:hypothetical protein
MTTDDRKTCPVCQSSYTRRHILRHIRDQHPGQLLSTVQLEFLGAKHCARCKKVVSSSDKGLHTCQPLAQPTLLGTAAGASLKLPKRSCTLTKPATRSHAPVFSNHQPDRLQPLASVRSESPNTQTSEPDPEQVLLELLASSARSRDGNQVSSAAQAPAAPVDQVVQQLDTQSFKHIHYAAQTVPQGVKEAFSEVCTQALNDYVASAAAGFQEHRTAHDNLLLMVTRLLDNTNGSHRRKHKVQANIKRYKDGVMGPVKQLSTGKRRAAEQDIANRVHKQLQKGNVTRAARALEAAEVAKPTPEVIQKLSELHPAAAAASIEARDTVPVQITRQQVKQVLKRLPRGSAPGPSGWTYEHIQAVTSGTEQGMDATLNFVNAVLAGDIPEWEEQRASRLIPLRKKCNGVRPIAIGEVWARLVSRCAMAACPCIGPKLAPLQVGVGVKGGSQVLGHAIRADILAHPEDVTLQLDFKNAFNTLSREAMLKAVADRAPQLLKLALWMYR